MESEHSSSPRADVTESGSQLVVGYTQAAVDDFLGAVARERETLQEVIKEARVREARAQGVIGMHELMVTMMLETHRELGARRRDAEVRASEIVRQGERQAEKILRAAYDDAGAAGQFHDAIEAFRDQVEAPDAPALQEPQPSAERRDPSPRPYDGLVIDLRRDLPGPDSGALESADVDPPRVAAVGAQVQNGGVRSNEDFFAFLRGALDDDGPLGPSSNGQEESWRL